MSNKPADLFDANIFFPLPNTLAYSEHLFSTALLALPIQHFFNEPVVTYNLSLLATFPLAAFGMYLLAFHWTGQRGAAFIAGLIFATVYGRFHYVLDVNAGLLLAATVVGLYRFSRKPVASKSVVTESY